MTISDIQLRRALENNEFRLYYQPKLDLAEGKIKGVEALIRWEHPENGAISPLDFIPLAEETGLITPIGEWVIRKACEQVKEWTEAGLPPMIMAVNLSGVQLHQPNLVQRIQRNLEETGLSPEYLELEITESMMMNVHQVLPIVRELKNIGVRISLDDFGTGYSSLYHLKEFPIDTIKIDQCFVRNCTDDEKDATIVKAIIAMAHQLKLEVLAEGIESKEHLIFLQQNHCDGGQGYLFSKPLSPEEFEKQFLEIERIVNREGIPHEISRQKWLEEALENSRQELRDTIRLQQGMIIKYIERDGKFIHTLCDGELLYQVGLTPEKLLGKELKDVLPIHEAERKLKYYRRAWDGEENVTYEGRLNGIWYYASLRPIRRGGQVVEVIMSCVDISKRKESEERYQKVVEFSPKGIMIQHEGEILYANPSAHKIFKEEDLVGKSVFELFHTDYHALIKQRILNSKIGKENPFIEEKVIRNNGEVIDVEVGGVGIQYNGRQATLIMLSDITERKKVELAKEESETRYKRLVELSPEPIVVHRGGFIQYANPAFIKLVKALSIDELLGKPIINFSPPEYRDLVEKRTRQLNREGISVTPTEEKVICLDGTLIDVEVTGISLIYDGSPSYLMMVHDLTDRKRAEEALRHSEEKYRLITENMQDLIRVFDKEGNLRFTSSSHKRILGIPPHLDEGRVYYDVVHPDDISHVGEQFFNTIEFKKGYRVEFRCKSAQDGWKYVESIGTPLFDEQGEVENIVVVTRDISERKKAEEAVRKSDRHSVVGRLAAGVAHEIRNPLTSISGFIQFMKKKAENPFYFDLILSEISRLEEIVSGFLNLSKPHEPKMKEINTKSLLEQVLVLFRTQANMSSVEIVEDHGFDLPPIYCEANQIKQVLINILQNAVEAMPNGGTISICTLQNESKFMTFRIIDEGSGISEERLKHIGEPFFSTKEKGTGLGLMLSQKIVHEHGGSITITSNVNQGTTVDVRLPIKASCIVS